MRSREGESRRGPGGDPRSARRRGEIQGDLCHLTGDLRPRRLAGAAPGGIDGEGGPGSCSRRPREGGTPRSLRRRPALRLHQGGERLRCRAGGSRQKARRSRPAGSKNRGEQHLRSGPGVLPLGDRHGGGRVPHGHQSLRPARRGSEQGRDEEADVGVRKGGRPSAREADPRRRRASGSWPTRPTPPP